MSEALIERLVKFAESGNQQKIIINGTSYQGWIMEISEDALLMSTGYADKSGQDFWLKFEDLTQEQINQIKAQDVDLTNYATKDDLAKVDVSSQLVDYAKKDHTHENMVVDVANYDGDIFVTRGKVRYAIGKRLALAYHTHPISHVTGLQDELENKAN